MDTESISSYQDVDLPTLNSAIENEFECRLEHCEIDVGVFLDPLLPNSNISVIDLSFLNELKIPNDCFLPESIYVRDCMRQIFDLFLRDAAKFKPTKTRTVLAGSPGVGRSILCFLAALYRAQTKITLYYRLDEDFDGGSVFIMIPGQDNRVDILFTRELPMDGLCCHTGRLCSLNVFLRRNLPIKRSRYHVFVDGPAPDDNSNALAGTFDYLCNSSGSPRYSSSSFMSNRQWILSGWTKEEALAALTAAGYAKEVAEKAYWLSGGNIRRMQYACSTKGFDRCKAYMNSCVIDITPSRKEQLVLRNAVRTQDTRDQVRTMFRAKGCNWDTWMHPIQFVDSNYAMNRLHQNIDFEALCEAYTLTGETANTALQALYFEHLIHHWMEQVKPPPLESVTWSTPGLTSRNDYWIPSTDLPLINSAIVVGDALCVLHTASVGTSLSDAFPFVAEYVDQIKKTFEIKRVVLYAVTPKQCNLNFSFPSPDTLDSNHHSSAVSNDDPFPIEWVQHDVDTTSPDSIDASLSKLSFLTESTTSSPLARFRLSAKKARLEVSH
jgi:hypothetical protein